MQLQLDKPSATLGPEGGKWLKSLVDASIENDKHYFRSMKTFRQLLSGEHWKILRRMSKEQVKMVVNLAHAHVRSLVPTLFFKSPSVDCVPTAPQHAGKEKTWNGVINNTIDKTGFDEVVKDVVTDAVLYPEGIIKEVANKPLNEGEDKPQQTTETGQSGPTVWLSKGAPVNVRIAPAQFIVDYLAQERNLDNARFCAVRMRRPLHEIKAHPIYGPNVELEAESLQSKPTTGNAVKPSGDAQDDWDNDYGHIHTDTGEQLVTIYEVWIHELISHNGTYQVRQKMCVLLDGQDKPIRELEEWEDPKVMGEGFNRYPFTRLVLNKVPDDKPQSEVGIFKSMQVAINWLMSRVTTLVENDRQITAVDTNKIKNMKKFRDQFYKGGPRVLAEVDSPDAVQILQPSFVGRDNYTLINLVMQFMQQVTGFGQNRRGGSGIRTATEASLVDQGTQIKTSEKVDTVAKFLKRVMEKKAMLIRSLTKEEGSNAFVFRVGGDVGSVNWVNFTSADLEWLPDIRIRVDSFRKMDSLQEMQKMAAVLQQAMAVAQLLGPGVRIDVLFARMLESAGIHDSSKIIGDQDKETMLQTIEIAGIITGIPTPVLETHNHAAHIQVIDAFRQSLMGQQIIATAPEVADRLDTHREEHVVALQELQQKAVNSQLDPFAAAGQADPTNQSIANEATAGERATAPQLLGGQ